MVISHPDRAQRKDPVEVIIGSSQRANRSAEETEFILDAEDGLSWATIFKCDLIYAVPKGLLGASRGSVTANRRGPLLRRILAAHGWAAWF